MPSANYDACQHIINQIKAYVRQQVPEKDSALIETFAQRYFASCSIDDLQERSVEEWFAILYSHWKFINPRKPGEAKIRVFNADLEKDGWHALHTIIEISHDDIPFLVDSTRMVLNRYGYEIHFIIHFGGLKVRRDQQDNIVEILPPAAIGKEALSEAPIYIEIDYIVDENAIVQLAEEISHVLNDVRMSVVDWRKMVGRVEMCLSELENNPPKVDAAELAESRDFLRWLINNNFTFLGARDYNLIG